MSESPSTVEGAIYISKPAKLDLLWESIFKLATGLLSPDELARKADPAPEQAVAIESAAESAAESAVESTVEKVPAQPSIPDTSHTSAAADAIKSNEETVRKIVPQENAAIFYNPDEYLLGRILASLNDSTGRECSIHVQCWKDRQLILLPDQRQVFTDLTDNQLMNLGIATSIGVHNVEITSICGTGTNETSSLWSRAYSRLLGKGDLPTIATDGLEPMSLDYFLWDLALHTARGRVPVGTDLDKPLYLQCWPNFPRLPNTAHGMRIASLWVAEPRTLNDIAGSLGIELIDVYSFYNAAAAIGLAGPARRQADGLVAPRVIDKGGLRRGLCDAILRHFGDNKRKAG
jgi:hypothetical protein